MSDIVLTTLNAKYAHAAFGLRYLMANLGELANRAAMLEFDIAARPVDVIEAVLAQQPKIVGIGVYIWNVAPATQLVAELKRIAPQVTIVLGGPEVSYETDQQDICRLADYVITGEADLAFAALCEKLLTGDRPIEKVIEAGTPEFEPRRHGGTEERPAQGAALPLQLFSMKADSPLNAGVPNSPPCLRASVVQLPYALYTDEDLAHRVIYVEASRGCPFKCEFCLSSLDVPVRNVPLQPFLDQMQALLDRGCRQFKFVDRTFNLNLSFSRSILQFFLERHTPGLFLHFEMIPDRLPEGLRELIAKFPPGALQFEVGVQSMNPDVQHRISRRQDNGKLAENLHWLRDHSGVHVHADLIVGLPGEDLDSFGRGFDQLVAMRPQEIQVGLLKRLRGTPIVRHDSEWGMVYSPHPPYEILQTGAIDFVTMQRLRRFSRYWDLIANSGNFAVTLPRVWNYSPSPQRGEGGGEGRNAERPSGLIREEASSDSGPNSIGETKPPDVPRLSPHPSPLPAGEREQESPFAGFLRLADWLYEQTGRRHGISLTNLSELLFRFLTEEKHLAPKDAADVIWADYQRVGRSDRPAFLKDLVAPADTRVAGRGVKSRQQKHLA